MIKVFGRHLCVPENEKQLGFVQDNLVETRQFEIADPSLMDYQFKLDIENGISANISDLPGERTDSSLILTWKVPAACLQCAGTLYAQLRAFSGNGEVWHSEIAEFSICRSIEAETLLPPVFPSEFTEMEERITLLLHTADEAVNSAKKEAETAGTYLETVQASAEEAKISAAQCSAILTEVHGLKESVSNINNSVITCKNEALASKEKAATYASTAIDAARNARESVAELSSVLGDMDGAIEAILSIANALIGGEEA